MCMDLKIEVAGLQQEIRRNSARTELLRFVRSNQKYGPVIDRPGTVTSALIAPFSR